MKRERVATKVLRLAERQRVLVKQDEDGNAINAVGTVTRMCTDGRAWVQLDDENRRHSAKKTGGKVRAYPEDCELAETNHKERREAKRAAGDPVPTPDTWGRDHWTTFAYIETCCVDKKGVLDNRRMRCDPKRHPLMAHEGSRFGPPSPTRLKDSVELPNHDDWDCADELEDAGLIENIGSHVNPVFRMTSEGRKIAANYRAFRGQGGNSSKFSISWTPDAEEKAPAASESQEQPA